MKQPGLSNLFADTLDTDFKAEVIAAELINNGVPAEQIMILLLGSMKRSFRKDVDSVTEEISDFNNKEYTLITTHKEGIYDMLPEGLFHSPALPKSVTTQKEILNHIKKHQVEERNARRFFLPYEAAINHMRIQMALYESRLDKGAHHNELVDVFKGYWEIFKWLDTNQSNIFLQVIPLIHDIRDDYDAAAAVFELLFSLPVKITSQHKAPERSDAAFSAVLNDTTLGVNFSTGNTFFDTGEDEIIVTVGPIDNGQLRQFMPGEWNYKILHLLCDYLLPVHLDISTEFELVAKDKNTRLADKEHSFNSILGLSTYL